MARKSKRKNPLSEGYLAKLPQEARVAFKNGERWGTRPKPRVGSEFRWWPSQDEAGLWGRFFYEAGWLVKDGHLYRTIWRFDDPAEAPTPMDEVDVDSDDYLSIVGGYSEDERVAAWRDYFSWVVENGVDPLDELKVSGDEAPVVEVWALVLKEFEKSDVPVAVELVGAKPSEGPVRTPETVPSWLSKRLSLSLEKSTGAWIIGNYASLAELLPELEAQGGQVVQSEDGVAKVVVEFKLEPSDAFTPRTEAIREAAREAILNLPAAANPRRKNPMDDRLRELEKKMRIGEKLSEREVRELRRIRRALAPKTKKTPGFFFAPWGVLVQALGATLSDSQEIALLDGAIDAADSWIRDDGREFTFEQEEAIRDVFRDSIMNSVPSVDVSKTILERIVEDVNGWGERGPQVATFERQRHKAGKAVDVRFTDDGAEVQLYRPFLSVYSEAANCVHGVADGGQGLKDHNLDSLIAAARWIRRCEGGPSIKDDVLEALDSAASSWSWPSDSEIEKAIDEVTDLVEDEEPEELA